MSPIGRRRFLTITAAAAGTALLPGRSCFAGEPLIWRGNALGAHASLILYPPDAATGRHMLAESLAEVERLEKIFSLYRDDSALVRLNREGRLDQPPLELLQVLALSRHISELSGGAFDVTVQPLWDLYSRHFAQAGADPAGPPAAAIAELLPNLGWRRLSIDSRRVAFDHPSMAVTLNGVAPGFVTDRVAELLRRRGMEHVLVNMDDIRAVGGRPDGTPWRVGVEGAGEITLVDRAVSTSSPDGTSFSPTCNHLFDPKTGHCSQLHGTVSVVADSAALTDALSTAIAVGGAPLAQRIAAQLPNVQVIWGKV